MLGLQQLHFLPNFCMQRIYGIYKYAKTQLTPQHSITSPTTYQRAAERLRVGTTIYALYYSCSNNTNYSTSFCHLSSTHKNRCSDLYAYTKADYHVIGLLNYATTYIIYVKVRFVNPLTINFSPVFITSEKRTIQTIGADKCSIIRRAISPHAKGKAGKRPLSLFRFGIELRITSSFCCSFRCLKLPFSPQSFQLPQRLSQPSQPELHLRSQFLLRSQTHSQVSQPFSSCCQKREPQ